MARIAGVDLPREKRVEIGLTYIFGIGRPTANKILSETARTLMKIKSACFVTTLRNNFTLKVI